MAYRKATFEEYNKASQFAQIRYRVGIFVNIVALILFIFTIFYVVKNIEEMKANPVDYAEQKMGVVCFYPAITQTVSTNFVVPLQPDTIREE